MRTFRIFRGTKELLKKSTSLMLRPSSGPTPLHYAVIASIELVTFLVNEVCLACLLCY